MYILKNDIGKGVYEGLTFNHLGGRGPELKINERVGKKTNQSVIKKR